MNANDYKDVERFQIGAVQFVSKAKNCGKDNCGACPHPGYWYAQIGAYESVKHGRVDIYLGRHWTSDNLLKRVAPALRDGRRQEFIELIEEQLRREDLAKLVDEQHRLEGERKRLTALSLQAMALNQRSADTIKAKIWELSKVPRGEGKKSSRRSRVLA